MAATHNQSAVQDPHVGALTPLRIALVADDELSTRGFASILREHREHFQLVTMASRNSAPIDIALYDHAKAGASRLDRLAELLSDTRVRKVAIFTSSSEPSRAVGFVEQGVCAYLSKSMTSAEIIDALKSVDAGHVVVPRAAYGDSGPGRPALYGQVLTPREADVLSHIARGLSNADIAHKLGVSINSVKSYIRACYRKIDVDSRSKAVLWALSHGLGGASSELVNGGPRARNPRRDHAGQDKALTGAASASARGRGEGQSGGHPNSPASTGTPRSGSPFPVRTEITNLGEH